jgi:uncharacterized protein (TIGR04141 family)
MKKKYVLLNAFRLQDCLSGKGSDAFDEFINPDDDSLTKYNLSMKFPYFGRLYVPKQQVKEPHWVPYLRNAFPELPKIENVITNRALMIIAVKYRRRDIYFGFSFGLGRYLLKSSCYMRNYGLKVALNAIYRGIPSGGSLDVNAIQSLDVKTVAANTIHTRRQSSRRTAFELFGVDVQRDILRAITGRPASEQEWGTRISGSDSLTIACPADIGELGNRCKAIETLYRKNDYREYFSWIDNIKMVVDPGLKKDLEDELLAKLKGGRTESLELAPPEIVDWDCLRSFRFSFDPGQQNEELDLNQLLKLLDKKGKLEELSIKQLRAVYRIDALDGEDECVWSWSVFQCLCGEFCYQGHTYILESGEFTAVNDKYRRDVDS